LDVFRIERVQDPVNPVQPPRSTTATRLEAIIVGLFLIVVLLRQPNLSPDDVRQLVVDGTELLAALAISKQQLPPAGPAV
jgi:hypothetical protein